MRPLFYLILLCVCLSACGQTGPLYIPQDEPAATTPDATPSK
ncbi:MAG: lipoprotein [Gammaproteobacteria bacterium]|nr:lipoprotein [Gammaproteobacteria bacterium]